MVIWWFGVVVSALASINKVNLRRTRLVLRLATVHVRGSTPGAGRLFVRPALLYLNVHVLNVFYEQINYYYYYYYYY